jgi:two-component system NarL family response regulator
MTIGVAIVEKQRMLRELLAAVLSKESDIRVVGGACTGAQALSMARQWRPDVLLLNIALPDMNGMEVARVLQSEAQGVKLIALSTHAEPSIVYGMLEAGAMGYVVKSAPADEVIQAIRTVCAGGVYLSPALALQADAMESLGPPLSVLGRRERKVLSLLAEGRHNREIAERLGISAATVDVHRRNIMHKLELHTVAELTRYAIRKGLISL